MEKINFNMLQLLSYFALVAALPLTASCDSSNDNGPAVPPPAEQYHDPITVGTYNIQYDNLSDAANPWSSRNQILKTHLEMIDFDIFGAQEPYLNQIEDMMEYLGDSYAWIGTSVTGDSQVKRRHFNPIFYKKDRFVVKQQGSFWFSDTPDVPDTKYSDSYSSRMCNWARFSDRVTGVEFYHFNMHFDHIGTVARQNSSLLIIEKVKEIAGDTPAFLTGDYNSNQKTTVYMNIANSGVVADSFTKAVEKENDKWHSFNDYVYTSTPNANAVRIDHVFVTTTGSRVEHWKIDNTDFNMKYPSDHFPVVIRWSLEKQAEDQ